MLVRCIKCEGKGWTTLKNTGGIVVSCSYCHGSGIFNFPDGTKICPECYGKGKDTYNQICYFCKGKRYVKA